MSELVDFLIRISYHYNRALRLLDQSNLLIRVQVLFFIYQYCMKRSQNRDQQPISIAEISPGRKCRPCLDDLLDRACIDTACPGWSPIRHILHGESLMHFAYFFGIARGCNKRFCTMEALPPPPPCLSLSFKYHSGKWAYRNVESLKTGSKSSSLSSS